jgi:hypothetical protein
LGRFNLIDGIWIHVRKSLAYTVHAKVRIDR